MMAAPSSPIFCGQSSSMTSNNINATLRRNSLVSDHEDMILLREKLTRIAVGRLHVVDGRGVQKDSEGKCGGRSSGTLKEHFKVFPLLPTDRPNTPPSSPQPRDVLRKQFKHQQHSRRQGESSREDIEDRTINSVNVEVTAMEDVEDSHAVHSPPPVRGHRRRAQAQLSIPRHLRNMSPFSILNKYPEGLRKRKTDGEDEQRASLKKTSSQINILATTAGKLSRSSSASGELYQKFVARKRLDQDQEMEDAPGCTTQPQSPQSPQNALYANKYGHLSACS
ncbi:hypothetical protein Plhal304r1_c045g0126361 [Plasmopara halstedii]